MHVKNIRNMKFKHFYFQNSHLEKDIWEIWRYIRNLKSFSETLFAHIDSSHNIIGPIRTSKELKQSYQFICFKKKFFFFASQIHLPFVLKKNKKCYSHKLFYNIFTKCWYNQLFINFHLSLSWILFFYLPIIIHNISCL